MKNEHLHLLIDEEIYLVKSLVSKPQATSDELQEKELKVDSQQSTADSDTKDPSIEAIENHSIEKVKFAFIHNTDSQEELELLNNIISACKLEPADLKIIKEGEEIYYKNAVIFTNEAAQFYSVSEVDEAQVLHSKPLNTLLNSKEEKGKLWSALQEFVR